MKVVLRHEPLKLYYAGQKHWVLSAGAAMQFPTVEEAAQYIRHESLDQAQVVVAPEHADDDLLYSPATPQEATVRPAAQAA